MQCDPCDTEDHSPQDCANLDKPMIQRQCTCRCTQPERPVAPYWTGLADQPDQPDQPDQTHHADQTNSTGHTDGTDGIDVGAATGS